MKILKYIIFLSILSGIFFLIYRKSDKKGFRRWWISFKIAVIIAAILAGLVSESAEAQEFNWYENNDQQVILVGRDSSGTPSPSNIGRQGQSPSNFPTPPSRGRSSLNVPGVNPYRTAPKVVPGMGAAANPAGAGGGADDQCPAPKKKQQSQKSDKNKVQSDVYNSKKKRSARMSNVSWKTNLEKIKIIVDLNINSIKMAILFLESRQKLDLRFSLHTNNHSKNIITKMYII